MLVGVETLNIVTGKTRCQFKGIETFSGFSVVVGASGLLLRSVARCWLVLKHSYREYSVPIQGYWNIQRVLGFCWSFWIAFEECSRMLVGVETYRDCLLFVNVGGIETFCKPEGSHCWDSRSYGLVWKHADSFSRRCDQIWIPTEGGNHVAWLNVWQKEEGSVWRRSKHYQTLAKWTKDKFRRRGAQRTISRQVT